MKKQNRLNTVVTIIITTVRTDCRKLIAGPSDRRLHARSPHRHAHSARRRKGIRRMATTIIPRKGRTTGKLPHARRFLYRHEIPST